MHVTNYKWNASEFVKNWKSYRRKEGWKTGDEIRVDWEYWKRPKAAASLVVQAVVAAVGPYWSGPLHHLAAADCDVVEDHRTSLSPQNLDGNERNSCERQFWILGDWRSSGSKP